MAFVLKVTAGGGKGTEYRFEDGQEAKLGRTADNDVVVKDAAASRSHARVFHKGGKFFVEDLGSANGTKVNKQQIEGMRELHRGDTVVIGDVVLSFIAHEAAPMRRSSPDSTVDDSSIDDEPEPEPEPDDYDPEPAEEPEPEPEPEPAPDRTAVRPDRASLRRSPRRAPTPVEVEAAGDENEDERPISGENDLPPDDEVENEDENSTSHTRAVIVPPPRAMTKSGTERAVARPARTKSAVVGVEGGAMSAADRARMRRQMQQSSGGRLQLMWEEMPKIAKGLLVLFMALMVAGSLGLVVWAVKGRTTTMKIEPNELQANGATITDSFGNGDDVVFQTPDQKTFSFATASPTRVVGVLHYQAKGISREEVTISLNGADLGTVPPDTLDADARELDLVLPAVQLRKSDEENTLVFDNVANPPRNEPWKVWNIWVEINPVPEMSAEDAERRAQQEIERAGVLAERRDIGAENLFQAWKTYREAWLLLEATPSHSVELHTMARTRMRELRPALDTKCNAMIISVKKVMNQQHENVEEARAILEDVPRYFPTREHPCLGFSQAILRDLESFDEPLSD